MNTCLNNKRDAVQYLEVWRTSPASVLIQPTMYVLNHLPSSRRNRLEEERTIIASSDDSVCSLDNAGLGHELFVVSILNSLAGVAFCWMHAQLGEQLNSMWHKSSLPRQCKNCPQGALVKPLRKLHSDCLISGPRAC